MPNYRESKVVVCGGGTGDPACKIYYKETACVICSHNFIDSMIPPPWTSGQVVKCSLWIHKTRSLISFAEISNFTPRKIMHWSWWIVTGKHHLRPSEASLHICLKNRPLLVNIFNVVLKPSTTETPWAGESIQAANEVGKQRRWSTIIEKQDPRSLSWVAVGCTSYHKTVIEWQPIYWTMMEVTAANYHHIRVLFYWKNNVI